MFSRAKAQTQTAFEIPMGKSLASLSFLSCRWSDLSSHFFYLRLYVLQSAQFLSKRRISDR